MRFSRCWRVLAAAGGVATAGCGPDAVTWDGLPDLRLPAPPITAAAAPDAAADSLVDSLVRSLRLHGSAPTTADDGAPAPRDPPRPGEGQVEAPTTGVTALAALPPDPAGTRCPASLRTASARVPAAAGAPSHAVHAGMPNATAPNATAPNATAPNATAPNATAPNAAMPNAGVPNAATRAPVAAAVWWARRGDGSAALYLSRTADGGRTWSAPLAVDTLDRSESACDRPAPSVAIDSANGYLHVAYSMSAPEGPGVFYAHQMDPRGPFERAQVIVYGDRPAATSVTSTGDRVVVAYEDPNTGGRPFVSLALSRTAGHSWAERLPVSARNASAERPVVALRGADQVVLGWVERGAPREIAGTDDPRTAVTALPTGVVVRVGRLRE